MKKLLIRFVVAVGVTGLFIIIVVAALPLLFRLRPVRNAATARIERLLDSVLVGNVKLAGLESNLFSYVAVDRGVLYSPEHSSDSIAVEKVRIEFDLPALLQQTIRLTSIRVKQARVALSRDTGDSSPMLFMPVPNEEAATMNATGRKQKKSWSVQLPDFRINTLGGTYRDELRNMSADVGQASVSGGIHRPDSIGLMIAISSGYYRDTLLRTKVDSLFAQGVIGDLSLQLERLLLTGDAFSIEGAGAIPFSADSMWDVSASATVSTGAFELFKEKTPDLGRNGRVSVDISMQRTLSYPLITLLLNGDSLSYREYRLDSVMLESVYGDTGSAILATDARFTFPAGMVALSGSVHIPALFSRPVVGWYQATLQSSGVNVNALPHLPALRDLLGTTQGSFSLDLSGAGTSELPRRVTLNASVAAERFSGTPLTVNGDLDAKEWSVALTMGENTASGQGTLGDHFRLSGDMRMEINDPSVYTEAFFDKPLSGTVHARSSLGGTVMQPAMSARVESPQLVWTTVKLDTLFATISIDRDTSRIDTLFAALGGSIDSTLRLVGVDSAGGTLQAEISGAGPLRSPTISARSNGTELYYRTYRLDTMDCMVGIQGTERISVDELRVVGKTGLEVSSRGMYRGVKNETLFVSTRLQLSGTDAGTFTVEGSRAGDSIDVSLVIDNFDIGTVMDELPIEEEIDGKIRAEGSVSGSMKDIDGRIDFGMDEVSGRGVRIHAFNGTFSIQDSLVSLDADLEIKDTLSNFDVVAEIPLRPGDSWRMAPSPSRPLLVAVTADSLPVNAFAEFTEGLSAEEGTFSADVSLRRTADPWEVGGTVTIDSASLSYAPADVGVVNLTTALSLDSVLSAPRVTMTLQAFEVSFKEESIDTVTVSAALSGKSIVVDTARARFGKNGVLILSGTLAPFSGTVSPRNDGVQYRLTDIPLSMVEQFIPGISVKKGVLHGSGRLFLASGHLRGSGEVGVDDVVFDHSDVTTTIGPLTSRLAFSDDTVTIKTFSSDVGEGSIDAGGWILLSGTSKVPPGSLRVSFDEPSLEIPDLAVIRVTSGSLRMNRDGRGNRLSGEITLGRSEFTREIGTQQLLDIVRPKKTRRRPSSIDTLLGMVALRLSIDCNRNLYVTTDLADLRIDAQLTLLQTLQQPGLVGSITIVDGTVYYLDRSFNVTSGKASFPDPFTFNPMFNLNAETVVTEMSKASSGGALPPSRQYTVTLLVSGSVEHPAVVLASEPSMPAPDIVSLLTLGTTLGGVGDDLTGRIQTLAANRLMGFGTNKLEDLLGLEDLKVYSTGFSDSGSTHVSLTKRITPRLTVTYGTGLQSLQQQEVTAIYRITPFLYAVGSSERDRETKIMLKTRFSW